MWPNQTFKTHSRKVNDTQVFYTSTFHVHSTWEYLGTLCLFTVNYSQHWLKLGLDWILILSHLLFSLYCLYTIWLHWFYVVLYFTFKRTYAHIKRTVGYHAGCWPDTSCPRSDIWTRLKPQLRLDPQFGCTTKWIMKSYVSHILRMPAEKYSFGFCYEEANTKMQNTWMLF